LARGVASISVKVGEGISTLADFVGGWENLGVVVGALMASKAIISVGRFAGSIFGLGRAMFALVPALPLVAGVIRAIGAAMAANPIGAAIAVIAAGAALIIANWETIEPKIRPILDALGSAFSWAWDNAIKPVVDGLTDAGDAIVAGWQTVRSGLGSVMDWLGEKFDWLLGKVGPVIDGLTFLRDKGAAVVGSVSSLFGGGDDNPAPDDPTAARAGRERSSGFNPITGEGRPQKRAIGGAFAAGRALLVGERGPEAMFPTQGGFIANNRALERMSTMADAILSRGAAMAQQGAQSAAQVTQNITVNAQGLSVQELVDELERRRRDAEQAALFDPAIGFGQYAGAG
jgi:hypothetical protein